MPTNSVSLYERLRHIESLDVYEDRKKIGTLNRKVISGVSACEFVPDLNEQGKPIPNGVYNKKSLQTQNRMQLPPYFSNLLPEGLRRQTIESLMGVPAGINDDFVLLAALGSDCIGNICVTRPNNGSVAQAKISLSFDEANTLETEGKEDLKLFIAKHLHLQKGVALTGMQDKVSAFCGTTRLRIHYTGSESTVRETYFIVKTENEEMPNLTDNESFFMELGKKCGLNVPNFLSVTLDDGDKVFLVERFDRAAPDTDSDDQKTIKIHVEDALQVMNSMSEEKFNGSWDELSKRILTKVDNVQQVQATQDLFRLYFYSYVVGNGDLHSKNISLWTNPESGNVEVAPIYDLTSLVFYRTDEGGVDESMALPLNKKVNNFSVEDFTKYAQSIGLEVEDAQRIMGEVSRTVAQEIGSLDLPDIEPYDMTNGIEIINHRCEQFIDLGLSRSPNPPSL